MANGAIDVAEMTFGIEIECTVPHDAPFVVGGYHRGIQVPQLPDGWNAQLDRSIQAGPGRKGVEIVSPVLKGADGLRQMLFAIEFLNSVGAKVNRSTGFHVHVGFQGADARDLERLVALVAQNERALYAAAGTRSRERGDYCRPIKDNDAYIAKYRDKTDPGAGLGRYHTLNLINLNLGIRPAVEFRVFSGTLSPLKAVAYIRLALGLVQKARTAARSPKWERENKARLAKGDGLNATRHLLVNLGWTGTYVKQPLGMLEGEGLPGLGECTDEVCRLARKYDDGADD